MHLAALLDARTPLLVADEQGVRIRLGRSWRGLTWGALHRVEVAPRRGLRDGRLVLVPRNPARVLEELDKRWPPRSPAVRPTARRAVRRPALPGHPRGRRRLTTWPRRWRDWPTVGPRSPDSPEVDRAHGADGRQRDAPTSPCPPACARADPRPALAHGIGVVAARLRTRGGAAATEEGGRPTTSPSAREALPLVASATPSPLRALISGQRAEVHRELVAGAHALAPDVDDAAEAGHGLPELDELRRPGSVDLELETESWGDRVRPIATAGDAVETIVIDDFPLEPADDPVIGPEFAAARTRLGLTVDELAERTRIRPHVIESIEVDDFAPCGGDFYARGHLRTLARVLGVDAAPLLAAYDERYADAPINPRRVFEAELASQRRHPGDPRRAELVGAGRRGDGAGAGLVDRPPGHGRPRRPARRPRAQRLRWAQPPGARPLRLSRWWSRPRPAVRASSSATAAARWCSPATWRSGPAAPSRSRPPVRVQATDGSVTVTVDGEDRGALGAAGSPGSGTFVVR